MLQGSRSLRLNGRLIQIGSGDVVVVFNPGDVHGCDQLDDTPFAYDSVTVAADALDGARLRRPAANDAVATSAVNALMDAVGAAEPDDLVAERVMVVADRLQMAADPDLSRSLTVPCPSHEPSALRTYEYLRLHLADSVNLGVLAAMEGLSPYALIRANRRRFSITPLQHLASMRIERACGLLAGGAVPSDVAAQTGFCRSGPSHAGVQAANGCHPGGLWKDGRARPGGWLRSGTGEGGRRMRMKYHLIALFTVGVWGMTFVSTKVLLVSLAPL